MANPRLRPYWRVAAFAITVRLLLYGYSPFVVEVHSLTDFETAWTRWDAVHYTHIAQYGYTTDVLPRDFVEFQSRFPPLQPVAIRVFSMLTGGRHRLAGMLASSVFLVLASLLLFRLVRRELDEPTAMRAVVALNLFPVSYFGNAAYAESLFVLLLAAYFYAVRIRRSYPLATLFLVAAVLTRSVGVTLLPLHLLLLLRELRQSKLRKRDVLLFVLAVCSVVAHPVVMKLIHGLPGYGSGLPSDPRWSWIPLQEPFETLWSIIQDPRQLLTHRFNVRFAGPALFTLWGTGLWLWGWRRLAMEYNVFAASYVGLMAMLTHNTGAPRYLWVLLPLLIIVATIKNRWMQLGLAAAALSLLAALTPVFLSGWYAF